ncbi:capsule biosynthesis protein [Clostridia bacterium]|nr:capsule biosynthesis protein [Clostridia bacterium]
MKKNKKFGLLVVVLIFSVAILTFCHAKNVRVKSSKSSLIQEPEKTATTATTATIGNMGDILIHNPILKMCKVSESTYNFDEIFSQIKPHIKKCDYAVINLETNLGAEAGVYSGYPVFKTPPSLIDSLKDAGFSMCLTANNHFSDGGERGFFYTLDTLKNKNMDFTGSRIAPEDDKFLIKEINGIKIGMVCWTWGSISETGGKALNGGATLSEKQAKLVNIFDYTKLDRFYKEQKEIVDKMKKKGAEVIICYMHWGEEYELKPNNYQTEMAQKLCDFGVDVIIGGHPHVIQPMDCLESSISGKKTLCIYSLGNAISNQLIKYMDMKTGHTEDGVLFSVTFKKTNKGIVKLSGVNILPTWVKVSTNNGRKIYQIIPLENKSEQEISAKNSFDRTMALLDEGVQAFKKSAQNSGGRHNRV